MSEPHEAIDRKVLYGDRGERPSGFVTPRDYDHPASRAQREIDALAARIDRTTSERKRDEYRALLKLALHDYWSAVGRDS